MENKKNNDSFSVLCYPVNRQCQPRKIQTEKEKKTERKKEKKCEKNTNQTERSSRYGSCENATQ